jgi:hypothetical protein
MSIGSMAGIAGSAAGAPLAQTKGADADRVQQEMGAAQHAAASETKAEAAAGVGEADGQEHQTADRDADGRLPWQRPAPAQPADPASEERLTEPPSSAAAIPAAKDPAGQSGNLLDLRG